MKIKIDIDSGNYKIGTYDNDIFGTQIKKRMNKHHDSLAYLKNPYDFYENLLRWHPKKSAYNLNSFILLQNTCSSIYYVICKLKGIEDVNKENFYILSVSQ